MYAEEDPRSPGPDPDPSRQGLWVTHVGCACSPDGRAARRVLLPPETPSSCAGTPGTCTSRLWPHAQRVGRCSALLWAQRTRPFHAHALWSLGLRVGFAQLPGSNHPGQGRSLRTPSGDPQAICPHLLLPVCAKWDSLPVSLPQQVPEQETGILVRRQVWREQGGSEPLGRTERGNAARRGFTAVRGTSEPESSRSGRPRRSHSQGPPWRTGASTSGVVLQGTRRKDQQRRHGVEESQKPQAE
ncbi:uncharacterized protein LOC123952634 [Meles meles]|uniref:uncharacterized protein LOC123952634 n=1 Tax=Meles meles TaxID=9662 RepID=UPI001E6A045B|nr:uncharacterized protein LOC123952634 [Meles meles]